MKITSLFTNRVMGWDEETGRAGSLSFGNALEFWAVAQGKPVTPKDAALAFKVTPELIRQVVHLHPWMHFDGNTIKLVSSRREDGAVTPVV